MLQFTIQNNALCQWETFKDSQNTFHYRYVVQSGKNADGSISARTNAILSRTKSLVMDYVTVKCVFPLDQWSAR